MGEAQRNPSPNPNHKKTLKFSGQCPITDSTAVDCASNIRQTKVNGTKSVYVNLKI